MAYRPEVGGISQPQLRPTAAPIDTYMRPNGDSGLRDLAHALGELSPKLTRLASQQIDDEKNKGRSDATSIYEDIKRTGAKIKSGEIAPHESRWYRAAAKEQVGRLMAAAYGQDLQLATQTDELLKDSTDPQDFDEFQAEHRKKWMAEHLDGDDPALTAGFNVTSASGILNARQSFVAAAADRLDGQVLDNTYTEHQLTIRDGMQQGLTVQQIAKNIADRTAAFYLANPKLGPDKAGKSLNRTTIEAVFDAARAFENPELLTILDHIPGGVKGSTLGQTRGALSKRDNVEKEIRMGRQNRLASEEKDEKRQRHDVVDAVYDDVFAALEKDPAADVTAFAARLLTVDRSEVAKLYSISRNFAKASNVDDQGVANGLYERAFENDLSFDAVATAFSSGHLTVKTAKDLRTQIRLAKAGRGTKALVQDPVFAKYEHDLDGLWLKQMGDVPGARGVYAQQQLRREWVAYRQGPEGAKASEAQLVDWLQASVTRNFLKFSDIETSTASEMVDTARKPEGPKAPPGTPASPKWETEVVQPWRGFDLDGFEREWSDIKAGRRKAFSPTAASLIERYQLRGQDVDLFFKAQRKLKKP